MKKLNNTILKEEMNARPGMTRKWVADHLLVSLSTVDRWLQPRTVAGNRNPTYRAMSDMALELFNYKVKAFYDC